MRGECAQRIGAAEARWAHNPEVIRSKRIFATLFFFSGHDTTFCFFVKKASNQDGRACVRPFVALAAPREGWEKKKVLPGIEPGFRDSESPVITVTLQDLIASLYTRAVSDALLLWVQPCGRKKEMYSRRGSNPRPPAHKTGALPLSYWSCAQGGVPPVWAAVSSFQKAVSTFCWWCFSFFGGCKKCAPGGARTPDPGLIRPMLYQLSYQSCDGASAARREGGVTRRAQRICGYRRGLLPAGWMAERSKAPVSGTGLFGGVGSNPTPITFFVVGATKFFNRTGRDILDRGEKNCRDWESHPGFCSHNAGYCYYTISASVVHGAVWYGRVGAVQRRCPQSTERPPP